MTASQGGIAIGGDVKQSTITAGSGNVVRSATYEAATINDLEVVEKIAPADVKGRLTDEGVELDAQLKQQVDIGHLTRGDVLKIRSLNSGPNAAIPMRRVDNVITRSTETISRREVSARSGGIAVGGNVIGSTIVAGSANTINTSEIMPKTQLEDLPKFTDNVQRALTEKAAQPGFLRVWKGRPVAIPDPYREIVIIPVMRKDGELSICSGVLVSVDLVISAAHCLCNMTPVRVAVGQSALLATQFADIDIGQSHSFIPCNKLSTDDEILRNINQGDVAVYKLTSPLRDVQTRQIATDNMFRDAAAVRAVGFGKRDDGGVGTKFAVDIVIASYDCAETVQTYQCAATHELVAAGLGRDTCGGDSGTPVYILGADVKLYIAAITSRSVDPKGSCGQGGIYVKLYGPEIKRWLLEKGVPAAAFAQ